MTECLIAFGGNLSNPKVTFQMALESLRENGFQLQKKSGTWRSPAWPPGSDQPASFCSYSCRWITIQMAERYR